MPASKLLVPEIRRHAIAQLRVVMTPSVATWFAEPSTQLNQMINTALEQILSSVAEHRSFAPFEKRR